MTYEYDDFSSYESVAVRKARAVKLIAELKEKNKQIKPVVVKHRLKLARSFWGQAWCRHISTYEDMDFRLEKGRSCLRYGAVVDLRISERKAEAQVSGSELYQVTIDFDLLSQASWDEIVSQCTGEINSLVDLLNGTIPDKILNMMTDPERGLFPKSGEIKFDCNCLDYADCCEHVAATLYGIGVHFDEDPMLFFLLRGQNPNDLLLKTSQDHIYHDSDEDKDIEELFGIEIDWE